MNNQGEKITVTVLDTETVGENTFNKNGEIRQLIIEVPTITGAAASVTITILNPYGNIIFNQAGLDETKIGEDAHVINVSRLIIPGDSVARITTNAATGADTTFTVVPVMAN